MSKSNHNVDKTLSEQEARALAEQEARARAEQEAMEQEARARAEQEAAEQAALAQALEAMAREEYLREASRDKTSAELETEALELEASLKDTVQAAQAKMDATVRKMQAKMDATVLDIQSRIDAKRKAAAAAREREEEQARMAFNAKFVEASKGIAVADCIREGGTVYDCVVRRMLADVPCEPNRADAEPAPEEPHEEPRSDGDTWEPAWTPFDEPSELFPEAVRPAGPDGGHACETPQPEEGDTGRA